MELNELIRDFAATELLSIIKLDLIEGELWGTNQHIAAINTVIKAPNIYARNETSMKNLFLNYVLQQYLTIQDH